MEIRKSTESLYTEQSIPGTKNKSNKSGLQYKYYEGQWRKLPDFNWLRVKGDGIYKQPDMTIKKQEFNYGLVYTLYLHVPETNVYQFRHTSD